MKIIFSNLLAKLEVFLIHRRTHICRTSLLVAIRVVESALHLNVDQVINKRSVMKCKLNCRIEYATEYL